MTAGKKDRVKAALETLNRTGWPGSRELTVRHEHSIQNLSVEELRSRLASLFADLSPNERAQLAGMGVSLPAPKIIETQFSEIPENNSSAKAIAPPFVDDAASAVPPSSGTGGPFPSPINITEPDNENSDESRT
jgi:hypothetical protein